MPADSTHYLFKHHPETCDEDDIWGQVKRTVSGKPVPQDQIELILDAIRSGLQIGPEDRLLDLCCGNGALTVHLFDDCRGGVGVDYSEFLVQVANNRFSHGPAQQYVLSDALAYVQDADPAQGFTKVLCYGAFPYFDRVSALDLLRVIRVRLPSVCRVFLGQLPDKRRIDAFFAGRERTPGEEDDPGGLLGVWRTPEEVAALAAEAGWSAHCQSMPANFFAAHYRFDAILTPV